MKSERNLLSVIDETLALLNETRSAADDESFEKEPLPSLLKRCEDACAALDTANQASIAIIHHFACTGGTLLSRCIEAMPNTVLLSEIDPLSPIPLRGVDFAPYDLIRQSQTSLRPLDEGSVLKTFLAGLEAMHSSYIRVGRRVVVRDHSHSHFCTNVDPAERPTIREIIQTRFLIRSLVTVRHPLDSFMSLRRNGWVMFSPDSLEEYCRRYLLFLNANASARILRYEDFVNDPETGARELADALELPYSSHWRDLLPAIEISGDSGRKSNEIAMRPRREVSEDLLDEFDESSCYAALCDKLDYHPAPEAAPICT